MLNDWKARLKADPIKPLITGGSEAVAYFTLRDLLAEPTPPIAFIQGLPEVQKLLRRQAPDGSWKARGRDPSIYPAGHYSLVETFKCFRLLAGRYQLERTCEPVRKAAEYLFSFQTEAGDIRGMIGNQYATYYTGLILSLLIRASYVEDPRTEKGLQWLLSMRQKDGGWTIPILTVKYSREAQNRLTSRYAEPVEGDRSQPFSHNWTNMVLQAFALQPRYCGLNEVKAACALMKSRFFQPDSYSSYRAASHWTRFVAWWPNLLTALEVLLNTGFSKDDPDVQRALNWFIENQAPDGLWDLSSTSTRKPAVKDQAERLWLSLAVSRMLKKAFSSP